MAASGAGKRIWIFVMAVGFLILAVFAAQARVEHHYRTTAAQHIILTVDSIDFRNDLTRLYGKFVGRPHTSQKVREIVMEANNGKRYQAYDIDGVDFDRWFQWEEDGIIPVEIDFPAMPAVDTAVIIITTSKGVDRCKLSRP